MEETEFQTPPVSESFSGKERRACAYQTLKGSFTRTGVKGLNTFGFMRRLRGKELKPGGYHLTAIARDGARNRSKAVVRSFTIKRP